MKRILAILISVALLVWLIQGAHWRMIVDSLRQLEAYTLAGVALAFGCSYFCRAMRIYDEFKHETGGTFRQFLRITLIHNAMVNIVPFRGGEAALPLQLKQMFQVPVGRAVVALLWLRLQDAFVVAALAVFMWPDLSIHLQIVWMVLIALAAWGIPHWARTHPIQATPRSGMHSKIHQIRIALAASSKNASRAWMWTLANWTIKLGAQAYFLAALLHTELATGLAGTLGAELAAILPIQGVAGFGTYEAGAAALLQTHHVKLSLGLQAALNLHLFVIVCALCAGVFSLLIKPPAPVAATTTPFTTHEH